MDIGGPMTEKTEYPEKTFQTHFSFGTNHLYPSTFELRYLICKDIWFIISEIVLYTKAFHPKKVSKLYLCTTVGLY